MNNPTPGKRLFSTASSVEVIVVKGAQGRLDCAGAPMTLDRPASVPASTTTADLVLLTKRYTDPQSGLLVLCTKSGTGPLTMDGRALEMLAAQALPSSD